MARKQQTGFLESVQDTLTHYSDFEGRTKRAVFWWFVLFYALVLAVFNVFNFVYLGSDATLATVLSSIFGIVMLVPSLAVGVRRLRDSGEPWQQIFWLLLPFAGLIILCFLWAKPSAHGK